MMIAEIIYSASVGVVIGAALYVRHSRKKIRKAIAEINETEQRLEKINGQIKTAYEKLFNNGIASIRMRMRLEGEQDGVIFEADAGRMYWIAKWEWYTLQRIVQRDTSGPLGPGTVPVVPLLIEIMPFIDRRPINDDQEEQEEKEEVS